MGGGKGAGEIAAGPVGEVGAGWVERAQACVNSSSEGSGQFLVPVQGCGQLPRLSPSCTLAGSDHRQTSPLSRPWFSPP